MIENTKEQLEKIVEWNKERKLDEQDFKAEVEVVNVLEELVEIYNFQSEEARNIAKKIYINYFENVSLTENKENIVDAFMDIIVFATGAVLKLGYNPKIALDEVIKEISSRKGEIIDGKFIKDKSPEAKAKWYKADFKKAKI